MKKIRRVIILYFCFFIINCFAQIPQLNGKVYTLPIIFGEQGPQLTIVSDATVKYNEYFSAFSDNNGQFNF